MDDEHWTEPDPVIVRRLCVGGIAHATVHEVIDNAEVGVIVETAEAIENQVYRRVRVAFGEAYWTVLCAVEGDVFMPPATTLVDALEKIVEGRHGQG
jgi:hypothetical protein